MRCATCGTQNVPGARMCSACGAALTPPGAVGAPAAPTASTAGAAGPTLAGPAAATAIPAAAATPAAPVAAPPSQSAGAAVLGFFRAVNRDRTGALPAVVVFVLGALISSVGWWPLSLLPRAAQSVILGFVGRSTCSSIPPGSLPMFWCSARVGFLTVLGPLVILVVVVALRSVLVKGLQSLARRWPPETHFLIAPLVATIVFTACWAGVHYRPTSSYMDTSGFLPQTVFPAVVGLYTYAAGRWGPALQRLLAGFFDWRDRYPTWQRLAAAIGIPILLSLMLTAEQRVTDTAAKSQLIVLVALVTGYLAMAPRTGDLLAGVRQVVRRSGGHP